MMKKLILIMLFLLPIVCFGQGWGSGGMSKDRTGDEEIDGKLVVTDSIRTTNVTANRIGINVSTFVCDFQFGDATPQFAIYDSDIDLVHATFAAIDSAAFTIEIKSNNPLLTFYGADGAADAWAMTLNTSDQALFTGASGGYVYDDDLLPDTDVMYDLGSAALQWDSLHVGDVKASVNVQGATYGSDASISDAELLTIDDGAVTEILVGGGAGLAPVWTTATGTGAPVRAESPTFTGTVEAGTDVHNGTTGNVTNWGTIKVYNDSTVAEETTLTNVLPAGYIIENIIFKNTTANEITNLDIGFSDGGGEIVAAGNVHVKR